MSKTKEELLLAYKKANKTARARILSKSGYKTEGEYLSHLMDADDVTGSPEAAKLFKHNQEERPVIHNVHIIDISGSMAGAKLASAVQGVNAEVFELQKDTTPVDYTHSLVEFSGPNEINTVSWKVPIKDAKLYATKDRGSTAMNQAVGETLDRLLIEDNKKDKVLVKIFTDGEENASSKDWYGQSGNLRLSKLIKRCEDNGFTITFIGTNRDIQYVVDHLGIDMSNTLEHANDASTMYMASTTRSGATLSYAKRVLNKEDVTKGFYKDIK